MYRESDRATYSFDSYAKVRQSLIQLVGMYFPLRSYREQLIGNKCLNKYCFKFYVFELVYGFPQDIERAHILLMRGLGPIANGISVNTSEHSLTRMQASPLNTTGLARRTSTLTMERVTVFERNIQYPISIRSLPLPVGGRSGLGDEVFNRGKRRSREKAISSSIVERFRRGRY